MGASQSQPAKPTADDDIDRVIGGYRPEGGSSNASALKPSRNAAEVVAPSFLTPEQQQRYREMVLQGNSFSSTFFTPGDARSLAAIPGWDNQMHRWADYALALAAYYFGAAMQLSGQGTAMSTASMTASGVCFFLNARNREINGPTHDIFAIETTASWLWMLASLQQFNATRRMQYAGHASWTGLLVASYYSTRYLMASGLDTN